jgi:hypothetical protein
MEEKTAIKISLLVIAIIVIILMSIFIYKLYNEKTIETEKSANLQAQINSLNEESTSNTVNNVTSDNSVSNNTITNLKKIEGTFYPKLDDANDSPYLIFYLDGTVESVGNYTISGTYSIENNVIEIKYTKKYGLDKDEEINIEEQINIIDENTLMIEFENGETQYYIKSNVAIVGNWNCTNALDSDYEEVSLREIFGSIISNGVGELTLNSDGTFTNYIGAFSSELDDDTVGTYTVSEHTIKLKCKSGKTETLTYLNNQTIEYPYDDYTLILKK